MMSLLISNLGASLASQRWHVLRGPNSGHFLRGGAEDEENLPDPEYSTPSVPFEDTYDSISIYGSRSHVIVVIFATSTGHHEDGSRPLKFRPTDL